jgi:putative peptidoglycan lipid II flippase
VLQKVISPLYFAREDTRTPFRYAVHAMIVNAVIAVGLAWFVGFIAAAIATTVAAWVMLAQLMRGTISMGDAARPDARLKHALPRIAASAAVMGVVLFAGGLVLRDALHEPYWRYGALALLVGLGMFSYGAAIFGTRAFSAADIRAALRRGRV